MLDVMYTRSFFQFNRPVQAVRALSGVIPHDIQSTIYGGIRHVNQASTNVQTFASLCARTFASSWKIFFPA